MALFIQTASQYDSRVYVEVEDKKVNAKSIMGMMTLGLAAGEEITVSAAGADEQQAIEHIERYLNNEIKAQ
ncbi:MAG TPA: HPr family phosphocarrier protein [Candidatus Anaerobutyricum stercoripullorum]|uniref:HPr family phosphocarrier protein n=1 Tax=Candidatus Anaerobutyricum stercoripullorum TaxID=2838456 RepID=A0A9D2BE49_9FIRM|nr:HPr family phosphocarrier protein [Candidatus Anaerobutyricum stercoripullorum]